MDDMNLLTFSIGDATAPEAAGPKVIAHVCNNRGGWGKGFVNAISARWSRPEQDYRCWHREHTDFDLGAIRLVQVESDVWISNMIAQHGYRSSVNPQPIRYDALERCLMTLGDQAIRLQATVHMPRIGCGLAGGTWNEIEPIIQRTLLDRGILVTVYDLN